MSRYAQLKKFYIENIEPLRSDTAAFIYSKVKDENLMDDLLQNTMIRAFENCSQLRQKEACKAWLFSIAKNEIRQYFRDESSKIKDTKIVYLDAEYETTQIKDVEADIVEILIKRESLCIYYNILCSLKPIYKMVIVAHLIDNEKFTDIAEKTGKTDSTIRAIYRRGMEQVREKLELFMEGDPSDGK